MRRRRPWLVFGVGLLLLAIGIMVGSSLLTRSMVPQSVLNQVKSVVLMPSGMKISVNKKSMTVSSPVGGDDGVLNFTASIDETSLEIGEQPTPQQFIHIPKVYDRVVEQSKPYGVFESEIGTVHLTRPKARQVAMLNTKGTYMLVQADKDLTDAQWRRFFLNIHVVK